MAVTQSMPPLANIEPERSRHAAGLRRIGTAHVYSNWIGVRFRADFAVYGIRDRRLLVNYEGGHRHGIEHGTGGRPMANTWISVTAFSTVEIFSLFRRITPADVAAAHQSAAPCDA
jgi:hypothetical protein